MPFYFEDIDNRANTDPVGLLTDFLNQLDKFFWSIIYEEIGPANLRNQEIFTEDFARIAYEDLREHHSIDMVISRLQSGRSRLEGRLHEVRLVGRGLGAKLKNIQFFANSLTTGTLKALKYLLELINSTLGSIKTALGPAGLAVDAIAEVKDIIEAKVKMIHSW